MSSACLTGYWPEPRKKLPRRATGLDLVLPPTAGAGRGHHHRRFPHRLAARPRRSLRPQMADRGVAQPPEAVAGVARVVLRLFQHVGLGA